MLLFHAKIAEFQRHLEYIHGELVVRKSNAYPNLAMRLDDLVLQVESLIKESLPFLKKMLQSYTHISNSALDTWQQLFTAMNSIADTIQMIRLTELPAHLALTSDDHFIANVVQALHREVGINDVYPVVSLGKSGWFATMPPAQYPLYFLPASIVSDPSELILVFHEIGHTLFRMWESEFDASIGRIIVSAADEKQKKIYAFSDPNEREAFSLELREWQNQAYNEIEEEVCDVIGVLLGGPAFVSALTLGLLSTSSNPYGHHTPEYPPLDCRMRLGYLVLQRANLVDEARPSREGWLTVSNLYRASASRFYDFFYDDEYLNTIIAEVEDLLISKNVRLYEPSNSSLIGDLNYGIRLLMNSDPTFSKWSEDFLYALRHNYYP